MKTNTGMTLIELLAAVALMAIIISVAAPNFTDFIRNNRIISQANDLVSSINIARAEAAKRKLTVTICGSTDGATCNTGNWESGWISFVDVDANGAVGSGDVMLSVRNAYNANTIRGIHFTNVARIQYNARGMVDSPGTFKVCDTRGVKFAKAININTIGRVRMATDDNNNGVFNDSTGVDITCP